MLPMQAPLMTVWRKFHTAGFYGIAPLIMTPYDNLANDVEKPYNKVEKNRAIIKILFGQIKRRFPHINSRILLDHPIISLVTVSCFVLDSVAKQLDDHAFDEADQNNHTTSDGND